MSISGISSNSGITAAQQVARKQTDIWNPNSATSGSAPAQDSFTSDFASILASVQSGDITGAQAALSKLTSDQVPADTSYSPSSVSGSSTSSATGAQGDVQSLLQAVQGGDLTAAQTALTSLQSDMQADATTATSGTAAASGSSQPAVHHHHHHHHAAAAPATTDTTTDPTADPTSSDSPFDLQAGTSPF